MAPLILHIATRAAWQAAQNAGLYAGDTLESEGFVHCSAEGQVLRVANALFRGQSGLVLLWIDPDRLGAEVRWEDLYGAGEDFPHVYGAIEVSAVVREAAFEPRSEDGAFVMPPGPPCLASPRLLLLPHTAANLETLHRFENDPELLRLADDADEGPSLDELRDFMTRAAAGEPPSLLHWAMHRRDGDRPMIGYVMLGAIDRRHKRGRVGVVIGEAGERGRGLGREALGVAIQHAFDVLGLERLGAEVYAFNAPSLRLFEGLGFRREGALRQSVWKDGAPVDEILYGLLRSEWAGGGAG